MSRHVAQLHLHPPHEGQCTAGDEGAVGIISSESIFAHFQGLLTSVQLAERPQDGQLRFGFLVEFYPILM